MTTVLVVPEFDGIQIGGDAGEQIDLFRVPATFVRQLARQPEKRSESIVLGMRPFFRQLVQSVSIEADMRAIHWIVSIRSPLNDFDKTMSMLQEIGHQRSSRRNPLVDLSPLQVSMCNVDIVPDPDVPVAR